MLFMNSKFLKVILWIAMVFVLIAIGIAIGILLEVSWNSTSTSFFSSKQVVAWVAVIVNLCVVIIALFVNVLHDYLTKARFQITCGMQTPWQLLEHISEVEDTHRLYIRLHIQNVGYRPTEACEVRVEGIKTLRLINGKTEFDVVPHDPRALKWIGRDCNPIQLSAGAYDLVDIGAINSDYMDNLRLDFQVRGHLDLGLYDTSIKGYRIYGTVYGKKAIPKRFAFELFWNTNKPLEPVEIMEVKNDIL